MDEPIFQPLARIDDATLYVIKVLVDMNGQETYGTAIAKLLNSRNRTVSPILQRLEANGWITRREETRAEYKARINQGRTPTRVYVKLTSEGRRAAIALLK